MLKEKETTGLLIKVFYRVYNSLGHGFLEKVYENAMALEARKLGLQVEQQMPIRVLYDHAIIGEYFADLAVNNKVLVELKVANAISKDHESQLMNYLKATPFEIGLLLNFGPKPEFRRRIMDNDRKGSLLWHSRKEDLLN
jgi:GxxExxY protein